MACRLVKEPKRSNKSVIMNYNLKFIIGALLLTVSIGTMGQKLDFRLKMGKEFRDSRRSLLSDIVGNDATGLYVVSDHINFTGRSTIEKLEHFNNDYEPNQSLDLDFKENGQDCTVQHVVNWHGRLYIFYSYATKNERKNVLLMGEIDKSTFTIRADKLKIGEIDYSEKSKRNKGDFNLRFSRDSSKLLVFYDLPFQGNDSETYGFNVLDDQMRSLWQKNVTLPYSDDLFDVESFRVDNSGNAYILGLIYKDNRKEKRRGLPNYKYEVQAYSDKGNTVKQYPVTSPDYFFTDMQIEISDNSTLICAGFYSEKGTSTIKGTYFLKVDLATKGIKTQSFKEFGIDFITQNMSEGKAKRTEQKTKKGKDIELVNYDLDKLLVGKDGSAILVAEQYYSHQTITYGQNGATTVRNYYHYDNVIAVKVNPAGQIVWAQKIPKRQITLNDNGFYSSYALAIANGKICFIFNDNPKNLTYTKGLPANYSPSKSVVMLVSINAQGEVSRQPLFLNKDTEVIIRPKVCEQISNRQVILFGQRKRGRQFVKVTF